MLVTTGLGWAGRCGGEMIDHRASRDRESGKRVANVRAPNDRCCLAGVLRVCGPPAAIVHLLSAYLCCGRGSAYLHSAYCWPSECKAR